MKERPILFSAPMTLAILEGRKTVTRRIIKPQPVWDHGAWQVPGFAANTDRGFSESLLQSSFQCPYGQIGDRLLVAREIPSAPNDDYCAGSDGLIYSRTKYAGFGRKDRVPWYPLSGHRRPKGYITVSMCHESKKVTRTVHSLICEAFYGKPPFKGAQVRHLDGNPENNCPKNLAWGTQVENWLDRKAHGHGMEGEKHPNSKLTDEERNHIRWAIDRGLCSRKGASRALGMSSASISSMMVSTPQVPAIQAETCPIIPRIDLGITGVKVERLQDIAPEQALSEGIEWFDVYRLDEKLQVIGFRALWESINGPGSWDLNPWLWAISFKRVTP